MSKRAADEEEVFPRTKSSGEGGDVGVGDGPLSKGPPVKRRKTSKEEIDKQRRWEEDKEFMKGAAAEGLVKAKAITRLRPHDYLEGMLIVAAVRECSDEELVLNLPFNYTGFVGRMQALEPDAAVGPLPPLSDIYEIGQLVVAVVTAVLAERTKIRIELSLRPALINAGLKSTNVESNMSLPVVVLDEQEHVYRVGFGVEGLHGVLKKAEASGLSFTLSPGVILNVVVKAVTLKGVVKCGLQQTEAMENTALSLDLVKAGWLVQAKSVEVVRPGLQKSGDPGLHVEFCGVLSGIVHWHYIQGLKDEPRKKLTGPVTARVLAVVPSQPPVVHLTLLPHLTNWCSTAATLDKVAAGQRLSGEFADYTLHYGSRILLSANTEGEEETFPGFCPHSRLSDNSMEEEVKAPEPGEKSNCRVLSPNYLDGVLLVTRRAYDMKEGTLVSVRELTPGQIVTGEVIRLYENGVVLKLSEYVSGLVTLRHLTEVPLATVPKRIQVGSKMKCRVLIVRPQKRQVELTAKKSLIKCDFALYDVAQARKDMVVTGFVSGVRPFGHLVNFFGPMFGIIPYEELVDVEAPAVGMSVRVRIKGIKRNTGNLFLSLDLGGGLSAKDLGDLPPEEAILNTGEIAVGLNLVSCLEHGITVLFKVKNVPKLGQMRGYIAKEHLADDPSLAKARYAAFEAKLGEATDKETDLPIEAVVLAPKTDSRANSSEEEYKRHVFLSCKTSQLLAVSDGVFVRTIDELKSKESRFFAGYVKEINTLGAMLSVGARTIPGWAPKNKLAEYFVETVADAVEVGQTVRVFVERLVPHKKRPDVMTFDSDLRPKTVGEEDIGLLRREAEALKLELAALAELQADDAQPSLSPGKVIDAEVVELHSEGAVLRPSKHEGLMAFALTENMSEGTNLEVGQTVCCAVLDIDAGNKTLDVSLQAELLVRRKKKGKAASAAAVKEGTELMVQLAMHKPLYSVLWAKEPPVVVFAPAFSAGRHWMEPRTVVVHAVDCAGPGGLRVVARCPRSVGSDALPGELPCSDALPGELPPPPNELEISGSCAYPDLNGRPPPPNELEISGSCADPDLNGRSACVATQPLRRDSLQKGQRVQAVLTQVHRGALRMKLKDGDIGSVAPVDISTDRTVVENPKKHFKLGQVYEARVELIPERLDKWISLSLIETKLVEDAIMLAQVKFIRLCSGAGLAVIFWLPNRNLGYAHITELFDFWVPLPTSKLELNSFHEVKILRPVVEEHSGRAEVSLRASAVHGRSLAEDEKRPQHVRDLTVGQKVSGYVVDSGPKGVFLALSNKLVCRIPPKHLSAYRVVPDDAISALHPIGKLLRNVEVGFIDVEANRAALSLTGDLKKKGGKVSLGIKPSLDAAELADDDEDTDVDEEDKADNSADNKEDEGKKTEKKAGAGARGVKRPAEPKPVKEEEAEAPPWDTAAVNSLGSLGERTAFHFTGFSAESDPEDEVEAETEVEGETKKLNKRQKAAKKKQEALEVQKKEQQQAEATWATNPTSVEDFERLLLGQGNTSIVWIRYMAFHLKMSDLERARQVAERAVKHVGFSDAKERFNMWVAFLNLEASFGTEESADAVFRRASSHNPAKHMHLQLARIHERNKRMEKASRTYEACGRKFGHSKKVWIAFLTFLYRQGDLEGARKILPKALAALPRRKHPIVVSKAALLEYSDGSVERGRSVFEGLLDSYPKRTDLWSVYLDAHIAAHTPPKVATPNLKEVRSLLERCSAMKLKAVKMRFFFKRWLDFEKRWGDVESQESVRTLARNFVESQAV